jgi:hypothetical protein
LFAVVNLLAAVVGYFSGRFVGDAMKTVESLSWPAMLAFLPLFGAAWGIVTGGAAGVVVLGVGALVGGILGGAVGAVALPVFGSLHRLFKQGEVIERDRFFPLAFGVTLTICAAILRIYGT